MDPVTPNLIKKLIPEHDIIGWRHHFHRHPELSQQEYKTAEFIRTKLAEFGITDIISPTPTSVLATIPGRKPGKTVLFRGDIDALPIEEEADVPFRSVNPGVMHACGHDTHAAMLLGTAYMIWQLRDRFNGTIKLLFQHAEEVVESGAKELVASGALTGIDAGFAFHIFPKQQVGTVGIIKAGAATANSDNFKVKIQGRGTHGSQPHFGIDPILIGAEIIQALNTIVSRNTPPNETAVVSIGEFHAGTAYNIIPDTAEIRGNVRTVSEKSRTLVEKRVRTIIENICSAFDATAEYEYWQVVDMVINDGELNRIAKAACIKALGEEAVYDAQPLLGSEDFAFYGRLFPTTFMYLGGGTDDDGCSYANHHPKFKVLDEALAAGVRAEVQILLDYLADR